MGIYLTGIALIAAAVSIIAQKIAELASLLLATLLAIFVLTVHLPGIMSAQNEMAMMMSMSGLLKDIGLAGGALTWAGISKN